MNQKAYERRMFIMLLVVVVLITLFLIPLVWGGQNNGLYYPGRYYLVRDTRGFAMVVDLETAEGRVVTERGAVVKLSEESWASMP